jgi:hypothetical protein
MKTTSPALVTYLNGLRAGNSDAPLYCCDLFTIWLSSGMILTYTNLDIPVSWNGYLYSASSVLISGLKYKASLGVSVDKQQINIAARATDKLGGIPFLQALQQGAFDGAEIQREKAFFIAWGTAPIGSTLTCRATPIRPIASTSFAIAVAASPLGLFRPAEELRAVLAALGSTGAGHPRPISKERSSLLPAPMPARPRRSRRRIPVGCNWPIRSTMPLLSATGSRLRRVAITLWRRVRASSAIWRLSRDSLSCRRRRS